MVGNCPGASFAPMRAQIEQHDDDTDRADLAAADAELAKRRARKGGRPRKSADASERADS